jgi:hypothetical protein
MQTSRLLLVTICLLLVASSCQETPSDRTAKYVVRRATTSGNCQVFDSQASPVGTVVIGGGPFNTKPEATRRMCELRSPEIDPNKCFNVNPANACDDQSQAEPEFELPNEVVRYLDTLPAVSVNIDEAILPNNEKLGEYRKKLLVRGRGPDGETLIFLTDKPEDQLSQLFVKFFDTAANLVDDAKHPFPKGGDDEPEQKGIGYNFGSRDFAARMKMHGATCTLKVFGLDCSGMLFQIFKKADCKGMDLTALNQSKPANLNAAIDGVVSGIEARSKGKLSGASLMTGDIVYWDKLAKQTASHIGIVLKSGEDFYVYQSNGSADDCDTNLGTGRGPRTFALNNTYWFSSAEANWTVLRYEVK